MSSQFNLHFLPLALLSLPLLPATNSHAAGETTRISVSSTGQQGNYVSSLPDINTDGRYVAFSSDASNLVPEDTNGTTDVFVHDRLNGTTTRVSVDSAGVEGNSGSGKPSISAEGRYVAFHSKADNLVPEDTNGTKDVFVHDRSTGVTTRVSVQSNGGQAKKSGEGSGSPTISADGRYVAFQSEADNLVPGDTNGTIDVLVHDRQTGKTTRASVDSAGKQGNYHSWIPSISADGRYVAFQSYASNLVPGDTNGMRDIFVHDRTTGITTRVSVDSAGVGGNRNSDIPTISADGRYVAFRSEANDLVAGYTNGQTHVFVHDRKTGTTTLVSVDSAGVEGNSSSDSPSISADGRYVAFESYADNLVPGNTNVAKDVFVHDRLTNKTTRVSVDSAGVEGNARSFIPSISADGRYVAFFSYAENLVPGDTNEETDIFVRDRRLEISRSADLQVAVTSEPATVQNGDVGRYLFTITNNGPNDAESVTLTDTVSAGKVWSLTPSQGYCSEAAVSVCRLYKLAAGESMTVRAVFKAKGNPMTQQVSVSAPPLDNVPDNNTVRVSTPVTP